MRGLLGGSSSWVALLYDLSNVARFENATPNKAIALECDQNPEFLHTQQPWTKKYDTW